jgi:membrane protein YdbS with pleckstrin-like domain
MSATPAPILRRAEFDPKLKVYFVLNGALILAVTLIGLPLLPLWLVFGAVWWAPRYFASLECLLAERALTVRRGVVFKIEKTIPLDKIQDLSLRHGPFLNAFGLVRLTIETAGQSGGGAGQGDAVLVGVIGAREFRDAVIEQRDHLADGGGRGRLVPSEDASALRAEAEAVALLREIRDSLHRLEKGRDDGN